MIETTIRGRVIASTVTSVDDRGLFLHLVAPLMLGAVKRLVGAGLQMAQIGLDPLVSMGGDADTQSDDLGDAGIRMGNRQRLHSGAHLLGKMERAVNIRFRQQGDKFLAAITGHQVERAFATLRERLGHLLQAIVAGAM